MTATLLAIAVAAIVVVPGGLGPTDSSGAVPSFTLRDETGALNGTYAPGVILGGASNASATFLGGIGVYHVSSDFSLPMLAEAHGTATGLNISNLTPQFNDYFAQGGVYAAESNGTAWLVGGQATASGQNIGTLISVDGASVVNLTPTIETYFFGGGVWAVGWNGTAWLVGGNSSHGPVLLELRGASSVTNLSSLLPPYLANGWVQLLLWNGAEWLVGGQGVFGVMRGGAYDDLYGTSPFRGTGTFDAVWSGTAWVVGGYAPDLFLVSAEFPATGQPVAVPDRALLVTFVTGLGAGILFGGRNPGTPGNFSPALWYWPGPASLVPMVNLSARVPSGFEGGEIQASVTAPEICGSCVFLVGEGGYNAASGYGVGALGLLSVP